MAVPGLDAKGVRRKFWSASPESHGSVLLCVPDLSVSLLALDAKPASDNLTVRREIQDPLTPYDYMTRYGIVALADMRATTAVASMLALRNRSFQIHLDSATNFADLRQGPAVLIGGFDNRWTMKALDELPYRLQKDPSNGYGGTIVDVKNQSHQQWTFNTATPFHTFAHDFAIIARFPDPTTGQLTIIIAGIGDTGTQAAGEFLFSESGLVALSGRLKDDPAKVSFEAVISTEVIEENSGQPVIVAITKL